MSLLSKENGHAELRIPLCPVVRKFHVDVVREVINANSLLCLSDSATRSIVAAIVCVNIRRLYPGSVTLVVCADPDRRILLTNTLIEFSVPPEEIYVQNKEKGKNIRFPKRGKIVFLTANAFPGVNEAVKEVDVKLVIIDDADKSFGHANIAKAVTNVVMMNQKCFRILGLCHLLDLKKPLPLQGVVTNLSLHKIFLRNSDDKSFMDSVLSDDVVIRPVDQPERFLYMVNFLAKGMHMYIDKLYRVSILNETRPLFLIHSMDDRWREEAMKTPFKDDVALVHSLIQGYKHMVLGGMHPFYLYMNAMHSRFPKLKQVFEENEYLRSVFNFIHSTCSNMSAMTDQKEKIRVFTEHNPKHAALHDLLQTIFESGSSKKDVAIVTWSPFTAQSLKSFCELLYDDKEIRLSTSAGHVEEKEFNLDTEFLPDYTSLEDRKVDVLIKTGHVNENSKRVWKQAIAMDMCSASAYRMKIGMRKSYLEMKPYESLDRQFFTFEAGAKPIKYLFFEKAFRMAPRKNAFAKFDTASFPHEFSLILPTFEKRRPAKADMDEFKLFEDASSYKSFNPSDKLDSTLNSTTGLKLIEESHSALVVVKRLSNASDAPGSSSDLGLAMKKSKME